MARDGQRVSAIFYMKGDIRNLFGDSDRNNGRDEKY